MTDDDVVIFMGDSGAYLTANHFPSPIHRPGVMRMREQWRPDAPARMSTPFFLRGAPDTLLQPARLAPATALPPMTVAALDSNVGGCRDRMPWKLQLNYYDSLRYSE